MTKSSDWFLRPRKHHIGGIWERSFHTENASDFFRPDWAGGIQQRKNHRSFWTCVWRKLGKGNRVIIVTSSFSFSAKCFFSSTQNRKAGVFKVPPKIVFEKLRCRGWFGVDGRPALEINPRFQIPPVLRAFSKSFVVVTDSVWTVSIP